MRLFKKTQLKTMKDQITDFFKQINYKYRVVEDTEKKTVIQTGISLSIGNTEGYLVIHHHLALVEVLAISPLHIPENKRYEVAKLFDLADGSTYIGNLQLNHHTGEVRCKTYFKYTDQSTNEEIIKDNFFESFNLIERYIPAAMKIVYAGKDAEAAFSELFEMVNPKDN
jgi:hypothetical protein